MPSYRFAEYLFDPDRLCLLRDGEAVPAQPRVLEMLALLIDNRDRVVTRDEMAEALWERSLVSEDAITKRIGLLRKVLGDTARDRRFIQTAYGKGARFVGRVTVEGVAPPSVASTAIDSNAPQTAPPTIVILPFRTLGTAGSDSQIATGLPDDITSALVKLRSLRVIARGTAFRYAGSETPLGDLRADLGVSYALNGTVERAPRGVRIYVELLRTEDEGIVWSENFRVAEEEVHEIRDELIHQIVNRTEIAIPKEEAARAALKMPSHLTTWEAYHRGVSLGVETMQPDFPRARLYLERAIAGAPDFARAHAALAFVHWNSMNEGDQTEACRTAMLTEAECAVALDGEDPMARVALATMLGSLGQMDAGALHIARALHLAPGMARTHAVRAGFHTAKGELAESLSAIDQAISLSPRDPHLARWLSIRLVNHILQGDLDAVHADACEIERIGSDQISALGWALTAFSISSDADGIARIRTRLVHLLPGGRAVGIPVAYKSLPPLLQAMLTKTFVDHDLMG